MHLVLHCVGCLQTEGSEPVPGSTTDGMSQVHLVIWGTDVNVQDTKYKFTEFLQTFVDDLPEGDMDTHATSVEPLYMARLEEVGDCLLESTRVWMELLVRLISLLSIRSTLWRSLS